MSVNMQPSQPSDVSHEDISEFAKNVEIDPRIPSTVPGFDVPFFQAGLAGYSDGAMRLIARRHGCPFCVTEALLDRTLICGGKGRRKEDPDLLAEEAGEIEGNRAAGLDDHPIAGQVIGTNPEEMAKGASILVSMGYEVIDVNLACPVKKIRKRNRGGHFLTDPCQAHDVLSAVRESVLETIPVTVKLRRGWDDTATSAENFYSVFDHAYDVGYSWATVHPRTVEQRYIGPSDWLFLKELTTRRPDNLIFGSGDVWCAADIFRMMHQTGVNGVSVARGCIGNPWIFNQARALMAGDTPLPPTVAQQRTALLDHIALCMQLHGEKKASRLMRKFGIQFSKYHPQAEEVRKRFIKSQSFLEWKRVIDIFYSSDSKE
ncbi:MAG: tRNA-dihydrouridine synthase family protein [Phycisphaerae bacterium]|nr:tRNA-dihydrouridine synthase family protein [Phycisphaerae bacterium]MBT6269564.1 tRNA-dihydrouridine synthase family protein [Phycisphaerae bacterium]MBT6283046.1 tRNA-dihydrouridine synthase family protein [Phycisphaerae bacterium]